MKICDDNSIVCCEDLKIIKPKQQQTTENQREVLDKCNDNVDSGLFRYIIQQKDEIISDYMK